MFPNLTSAFAGFSTYLKNSPGMLIDLSFGNGLLGHLGSCPFRFSTISASYKSRERLGKGNALNEPPCLLKEILVLITILLVALSWVDLEFQPSFPWSHLHQKCQIAVTNTNKMIRL